MDNTLTKSSSVMDFAPGMIVKMNVGSRSHVTRPYYVRVDFYNPFAIFRGQVKMITSIPGKHSCQMVIGNNWEYHNERMEFMGHEKEFGHLLYNQELD